MQIRSVNPATGEELRVYEPLTARELEEALNNAEDAFSAWREMSFAQRAERMTRVGELLESGRDGFAALIAREMGKPLAGGRAEVEKCAQVCRFYADRAASYLADEEASTEADRAFVSYRPLGPILGIMPWNFPFWQVFRFAAPTLMAGNVALLKHAENVPGCALAIQEVFAEAGFSKGVFQSLRVTYEAVDAIIAHRAVRAVTLTGSTRAGRAVAAVAGGALKKTVLELGGSDPYVVLDDADLASAAEICVNSRLVNGGQSCIAAKRFIVTDKTRDRFQDLVVDRMRRVVVGDPFDDSTDIGPMAREDLRSELHRQVEASVRAGAQCLLGGKPSQGRGFYYPPTVLAGVRPGMPAYDEELFGPVAAVISASDEAHALSIANDSDYGLGAAIFTRDVVRGERLASDHLEAGCCFVNASVRSDPRLPFGGVKDSGYGRELSRHGLLEFVNAKTVWRDRCAW